jgi:drug/metabolite transporter (DMT)-like permease
VAQAWLQVIGLIVEFAGVVLLAMEWFTAQRQEAAERAIATEQARREEGMARLQQAGAANPGLQRHLEMSRDVQRRMTETRAGATRQQFTGMRVRTVMGALALLVAGFLLQLAGSWPGCCRLVGIIPAG